MRLLAYKIRGYKEIISFILYKMVDLVWQYLLMFHDFDWWNWKKMLSTPESSANWWVAKGFKVEEIGRHIPKKLFCSRKKANLLDMQNLSPFQPLLANIGLNSLSSQVSSNRYFFLNKGNKCCRPPVSPAARLPAFPGSVPELWKPRELSWKVAFKVSTETFIDPERPPKFFQFRAFLMIRWH